jgi:cytochrome c551/c552
LNFLLEEMKMKAIFTSLAVASLLMAGNAMAVDMPADGKAKCGACHTIETKKNRSGLEGCGGQV